MVTPLPTSRRSPLWFLLLAVVALVVVFFLLLRYETQSSQLRTQVGGNLDPSGTPGTEPKGACFHGGACDELPLSSAGQCYDTRYLCDGEDCYYWTTEGAEADTCWRPGMSCPYPSTIYHASALRAVPVSKEACEQGSSSIRNSSQAVACYKDVAGQIQEQCGENQPTFFCSNGDGQVTWGPLSGCVLYCETYYTCPTDGRPTVTP